MTPNKMTRAKQTSRRTAAARKPSAQKTSTRKTSTRKASTRNISTRKASPRPTSAGAAAPHEVEAQLTAIERGAGEGEIDLGRGIGLHVSSLGKLYFPEAGVTKGALMRYYTRLSPVL